MPCMRFHGDIAPPRAPLEALGPLLHRNLSPETFAVALCTWSLRTSVGCRSGAVQRVAGTVDATVSGNKHRQLASDTTALFLKHAFRSYSPKLHSLYVSTVGSAPRRSVARTAKDVREGVRLCAAGLCRLQKVPAPLVKHSLCICMLRVLCRLGRLGPSTLPMGAKGSALALRRRHDAM